MMLCWLACARYEPADGDAPTPGPDGASDASSQGSPGASSSGGAPDARPGAACTTPWGASLADGSEIIAYDWLADAGVDAGACSAESRRCVDGALSGSFMYPDCVRAEGQDCDLPWGGTLAGRGSVVTYEATTVPWNQPCATEARVCNDGALTGSFVEQTCSPALPPTYRCDPAQDVLASLACGTLRCLETGKLRVTFSGGNSTTTNVTARFTTNFIGRCPDLVCDANPQSNRMDCIVDGQSFSLPLAL